jgi:hypothetical protein
MEKLYIYLFLVHMELAYLELKTLIFVSSNQIQTIKAVPSGLFPSGFSNKILHIFLFSPFVLHSPPVSSSSTW